jgi:Domain of unknown function (DUF397)
MTSPAEPGSKGAPNGALAWHKSSYSAAGAQCVEAAQLPGGGQAVRDSKDVSGPVLVLTARQWHAFIGGVKDGDFSA